MHDKSVRRIREEVEERVVGYLEALNLRAVGVERQRQENFPSDTIVGHVLRHGDRLDVVVECLVEQREADLARIAEVMFKGQIELPGGDRLEERIERLG